MKENVNITLGGSTLLNLLLIVFIILKLTKVITWSWWLVLIPLWLELVGVAIGLAIVFIIHKAIRSKF